MVAVVDAEVGAESLPELGHALQDSLAGGGVAQADEGRIARVIAVGDDAVEVGAAFDELVEEVVVAHRVALPEVVAIEMSELADDGIGNGPQLKVVAAGLFGGAGVVNVAQNPDRAG